MDSLGDLALARQLQAEFGRTKPPKLRGRDRGGRDRTFQAPSEPQFQYQQPPQSSYRDEHMSFAKGRKRHRNRDGETATFNAPRKAWHGELVTNTSPGYFSDRVLCSNALGNKKRGLHIVEAGAFFHQPQPQASLSPPILVTTPAVPDDRRLDHRQPGPDNLIDLSIAVDEVSFGPSGMSCSPKTSLGAFPPTSTVPVQQNNIQYSVRIEDQEDTEMELDHGSPNSPLKSTETSNSKRGLAASMWNPANGYVRVDSVDSNRLFETSSETTRSAPIVTSGLTKGPGLKASRWNQES
ncbi:hypothetical protein F5Y03DRAFT_389864 [Xylaria venustula]|nr:hypothetical protein F5Y03DRAFT_389864 [Xylaria venustula]